jgi:hypothetical protein
MAADEKKGEPSDPLRDAGKGIDRPRLTPQGRTDPDDEGEDRTAPDGGMVGGGQPNPAEG